MNLYRITEKSTHSLQPGSGGTFWNREVLYCGYDRDEARRVYHANVQREVWHGHGNSVLKIVCEIIADGETDDFEDDTVSTMEI